MKVKDPKVFQTVHSYLTEYVPIIKRRDDDTVEAYKTSLNQFLNHVCKNKKIQLMEISASDFNSQNILGFIEELKESGYAVKTINLKLSGIKGFCKYAMKNNILKIDQLNSILEIGGLEETEPRKMIYLSLKEITELLKMPDQNSRFGARDRFYLIFLYDSGARDSEVLNCKTTNFTVNKNGAADVNFLGKGNKSRVTPISKEVVDSYRQYLKYWKAEEYLFYTSRKGIITPMSADNAQRILDKYESQMRIIHPDVPHLHPHLFRHSRAMHLLEAGVPLPIIQEWLGHSNIETTRIYAMHTTQMKRKESEKVLKSHPNLFPDVEFAYENDEEVLRKLAGLK